MHAKLEPCVGTGRFLFEASLLMPKAPLILFGIEINPSLYRACLVNMALFSNHPYSIICADTLRLDPSKTGPLSKIWDWGNRWVQPDVSAWYWKPPPIGKDRFSLKAFTKLKKWSSFFWGDNLKIEMRDQKHLWVTVNPGQGDPREIIIDTDKDVRICDGHHVVKVQFKDKQILDILVDDIFVCSKDTWPPLIR